MPKCSPCTPLSFAIIRTGMRTQAKEVWGGEAIKFHWLHGVFHWVKDIQSLYSPQSFLPFLPLLVVNSTKKWKNEITDRLRVTEYTSYYIRDRTKMKNVLQILRALSYALKWNLFKVETNNVRYKEVFAL